MGAALPAKATLNPALSSHWKTKADIKVLKGGRASSKCMAKGTSVIMADYTVKNIENIVFGDKVMGPDGLPRNVIGTASGVEKMYRVKQFYGDDYTVNASHILSLKKRHSDNRYPNEPDILNINIEEFLGKSKKFQDYFRGYKSGLIDFPFAALPLDPYFLGLWLGDGSYREATITTGDKETESYLVKYAEEMACSVNVRPDKRSAGRAIEITAAHNTNKIWDGLKACGVAIPRKRGTKHESRKHIPLSFLMSSESQRLELLAGLMDSDGCYSREKNSYCITQKKIEIHQGIKRLCNSLGFRTTESKRLVKYKTGDYYTNTITITGDLWRIPCKIPRKKAKKVSDKTEYLTNTLRIEDIGEGEYYGITLDGDHLYLLADHTVTHNTWDAAGFAIFLAANYKVKFLCMRQFQSKIAESVYAILKQRIIDFDLRDEFEILKSTIKHKQTGAEFHFYGIHRNIEEIKGFEGANIAWIEEAEGLTKEQWKIIEPTIRQEGAETWILYNPKLVSDFVETFVDDPKNGIIVRQINYDENQFLSKKMLRTIRKLREEDYEEYRHIYLGVPLDDDDRVVIKRSWINASIDLHIKLGIDDSGENRLGFDVADSGIDKNAWVHTKGIVNYSGDQWNGLEDELLKSCTRVYNKAIEVGATTVGYDSIGVGASAGAKFAEINEERYEAGIAQKISYFDFCAGAGVIDPEGFYINTPEVKITNQDMFDNLKAQSWWLVADRFKNAYNALKYFENRKLEGMTDEEAREGMPFDLSDIISISSSFPDLASLVTELSTPRRDYAKNGKVKVESKDDLKKREIESPNYAEAFIIANSPREIKRKGFFDVKW